MQKDVPAVSAAIRILERLREAGPVGRPAGLLSRELAINRSTCYQLLHTLRRWDWVSQAGQRWTVGPGLSRFGANGAGLTVTLQEELETLTRAFPFVVAFAVQRSQKGSFVIVAKAEVAQLVRLTVEVGASFPPHAPALRRVFDAWPSGTGSRPAAPQDPPDTLGTVRQRGYAVSLREFEPEHSAVAAPVFDASGSVRWGLCVLAFASRLHAANVADVAQAVVRAAQRVSKRAGGIWPEAAGM